MTLNGTTKLSSLSEWSIQHIKGIFEAEADEDSLRNISATFADNVSGYVNGSPLNREGIERLVLTMRRDSLMGLKVDWKHLVEAPQDRNTNRDGSFGGYYVIRGLHKQLPGETDPVECERHKMVTVQIASQSSESSVDSRRIVYMMFVAADVGVEREQAARNGSRRSKTIETSVLGQIVDESPLPAERHTKTRKNSQDQK